MMRPQVLIGEGTFKYVLARLWDPRPESEGGGRSKLLVWGDPRAPYHNDLLQKAKQMAQRYGGLKVGAGVLGDGVLGLGVLGVGCVFMHAACPVAASRRQRRSGTEWALYCLRGMRAAGWWGCSARGAAAGAGLWLEACTWLSLPFQALGAPLTPEQVREEGSQGTLSRPLTVEHCTIPFISCTVSRCTSAGDGVGRRPHPTRPAGPSH